MAKLFILLEQAMENANILTNFKKFLNSITVNEEGKHLYQNVHLKIYNRTFNAIKTHYKQTVSRICSSVEKCFAGIQESPIFKNIEVLLDTKSWPKDKDSGNFGDEAVKEICHFQELLSKNNCKVNNIMSEWITLKTHMLPLVKNNKCVKYLDIWSKVFTSKIIKEEYKNILHIFEIMLIVPFTNAKVEHIFSKMNQIKTDSQNRLSRARLDVFLRVGEEGPSIESFNANPVIDLWFNDRVRILNAGPLNYKRKKNNEGAGAVDLDSLTMSDLENREEFDFFTFP